MGMRVWALTIFCNWFICHVYHLLLSFWAAPSRFSLGMKLWALSIYCNLLFYKAIYSLLYRLLRFVLCKGIMKVEHLVISIFLTTWIILRKLRFSLTWVLLCDNKNKIVISSTRSLVSIVRMFLLHWPGGNWVIFH